MRQERRKKREHYIVIDTHSQHPSEPAILSYGEKQVLAQRGQSQETKRMTDTSTWVKLGDA